MSNQKAIALDIISQVEAAFTGGIEYSIAYRRMYIDALENLPAAGSETDELKITIAPVNYKNDRIAWGGARITATLGIICEKMVVDPTNDSEIDPLETFVESLSTFFVGARKFATVWNASEPTAIFGDDYISELYGSSRFFVPIMIEFFQDVGGL